MIIEPLESRIAPATVFAVETSANKLISFDSSAPGALLGDVTISGLLPTEVIAAIDFRPATGELYGFGVRDDGATRTGRLYRIDPITAAATLLSASPINGLSDTDRWGFDFDPIFDEIRVTSGEDQNFRIDPDNGNFSGADQNLSDGAGTDEVVSAVAYDRNYGSNVTTLYGYDFQTDNLYTVGGLNGNPSPNIGTLSLVARATLNGINFTAGSSLIGFDIGGNFGGPDMGWIALRSSGTSISKLYTIDLATAAMSELGIIGDGSRLLGGLAVQLDGADPSITVDGRTATWTDIDGDSVTLKITKGALTPANFRMFAGDGGTSALARLNLADAAFTGTNLTISAKPGANGGDGRVNVGEISAVGVDLGVLKIAGDLIAIDAGDPAAPAPSLKSLTVASMAAFGTAQLVSIFSFDSNLADGAVKISIAGDFAGTLNTGNRTTGSVTIGGDIRDAGRAASGIFAHYGGGLIGKLIIKGDVRGGEYFNTSNVFLGNVRSVSIGGSIIGGDAENSGRVSIGGAANATITVGGSIIGGTAMNAGVLNAESGVRMLKIGGDLVGGSGTGSGSISATGAVSVTIKGDVLGSSGTGSGSIIGGTSPTAIFKSLTIGGSVLSESTALQISATRIGSLVIKGDVSGTSSAPVNIFGFGFTAPADTLASIAIGKVSIGGNLSFARILAGVKTDFSGNTADAAIGAVKIAGNMVATTISAGIVPTNGSFGDLDDAYAGGNTGNADIIAKLASLTIGGQLIGTIGGPIDSFGILAEQIGVISVAKFKLPLTVNDDNITLGITADIRVREL